MPLEDLQRVIETLRGRISEHAELLGQNECRTRLALIDPLLEALGWVVGDPAMVIPEYDVNGKRADYALLLGNGSPCVFLEAKRLGESLANHRSQVVAYASELGIRYPALSNGNNWEVYDNSLMLPIEQRKVLDVEIAEAEAATSAMRLLFLWRANQFTGMAISPQMPTAPEVTRTPDKEGWGSFANLKEEGRTPPKMRFPDGVKAQPQFWYQVLAEVAEWLVRMGSLTPRACPAPRGRGTIVNSEPRTEAGRKFYQPFTLSNGVFLDRHGTRRTILARIGVLLEHFQQDISSIEIRVG